MRYDRLGCKLECRLRQPTSFGDTERQCQHHADGGHRPQQQYAGNHQWQDGDHHQKHCTYCITAFPKEQHNFVNGVCTVCGVEKLEIGGSTSIEEISVKREEFGPATEYFDLQGRKFSGHPTQKGIYVVNGNLVVIK